MDTFDHIPQQETDPVTPEQEPAVRDFAPEADSVQDLPLSAAEEAAPQEPVQAEEAPLPQDIPEQTAPVARDIPEQLPPQPQFFPPQPQYIPPQPYMDAPYAQNVPPVYPQQNVYQPQPAPSPFANGPYVVQPQPAPAPFHYEPQIDPVKKAQRKAEKKAAKRKARQEKGGIGKRLAAVGIALALVFSTASITAIAVNARWEEKTQEMSAQFQQKLDTMKIMMEGSQGNGASGGNSVSGTPAAPAGSMTPGQVYAQNKDTVVLIYCEIGSGGFGGSVSASTGSGFIITENGYVVTNHHVVEGASRITVTTADGTEYRADYIGGDANNDVALVKIDEAQISQPLHPATLGSSSQLVVGDQVAAIGNPLGELTSTLTVGYISAMERDVNTSGVAINMLQTDAAINSGNSGGPLFNMKGEVIGITSAKYSGTSSSGASIEGIGFAIPIDDVEGMLMDLMEFGFITGPFLGVKISDMDPAAAQYYGLPMGAYVAEVMPGHCAEKAGIRAKDIITNVGGHQVDSSNDLGRALRNFKAGETILITVFRSGQELVLSVTLDEKPQEQQTAQVTPDPSSQLPQDPFEDWSEFFPFFGG